MSEELYLSPSDNIDEVKLTEESSKIIEKLESKEKNYQRKINQLQKENIILTNKINDLEEQKKRLRHQKMEYQKELEMTKHKVSVLEKEIDDIEILQSCASFSGMPKETPEKSFSKLKRKIVGYKEKFHLDTAKKEEIAQENLRLIQIIEENEAKFERAQQIIDDVEKYEIQFDLQRVAYKKIQAILQGFFNDFEEIRVYQQIESDLISTNFISFSQKILSFDPDTLVIDHEVIQETIMGLLNQIEFGIKASLNLKTSAVEIADQLQQKQQQYDALLFQLENMEKSHQESLDARSLYESENSHLKDELVAIAEKYQQDKSQMFKKLTLDASEEIFQMKSDNEKLLKENQFLDEMMSKLVNLMPSQDTQELIQEIIEKARHILVSEKERIYIEQLLEINEQNMKMAIYTLPQDITDDDICVIRKNVEKYRESLKNCSQQKQMMINDLSDLLTKLDRAAIIQAYRLQAIRSTEKDEVILIIIILDLKMNDKLNFNLLISKQIINQAYLELIEKDKQKQKTQQNSTSANTQKESQETVYRSARELLQQRSKREGNPLLAKNTTQKNQDILDEELEVDQKFKSSLQNASFTIKSILSKQINIVKL